MTESSAYHRERARLANLLMASCVAILVHGCSSGPDAADSVPANPAPAVSNPATASPEAAIAHSMPPQPAAPEESPARVAGNDAAGHETVSAKLVERLNRFDAELDALRARLETAIADLEHRIPAPQPAKDPVAPRVDALQTEQKEIESKLAALESRVDQLKPTPRPVPATDIQPAPQPTPAATPRPKKPHRPPIRPPFMLEAVETWDGTPQAVLNQRGRLITVGEGDTASGWRIDAIHYPNRVTVVHRRTGRKRELRCHG